MMSNVQKVWSCLNEQGSFSEGYVRLRLPDIIKIRVYAARNLASHAEALMFEIATASLPSSLTFPEGAGFILDAVPLTPGRHGQTRITLEAVDVAYGDVFLSLAEDVAQHLSSADNEREAVQVLLRRLAKWQAFLKKFGGAALSIEQRRGLWGELRFLKGLAERIGWESAVNAWKGFHKANHDFQCPNCAIEIKTTAASTPHAFGVSNVRQLDDEGIQNLFLVLFKVEETDSGGDSLPEAIATIRDKLEYPYRSLFDDGLLAVGYVDGHAKQYRSPRYVDRGSIWFGVREGFPRILDADIPTGIEDLRYRVSIDACADFEMSSDNVMSQIEEQYVG